MLLGSTPLVGEHIHSVWSDVHDRVSRSDLELVISTCPNMKHRQLAHTVTNLSDRAAAIYRVSAAYDYESGAAAAGRQPRFISHITSTAARRCSSLHKYYRKYMHFRQRCTCALAPTNACATPTEGARSARDLQAIGFASPFGAQKATAYAAPPSARARGSPRRRPRRGIARHEALRMASGLGSARDREADRV